MRETSVVALRHSLRTRRDILASASDSIMFNVAEMLEHLHDGVIDCGFLCQAS